MSPTPPISKDTGLLIAAEQKIRNLRKYYSTEDTTMFDRNAGLLVKLKDITTALDHDNCVLNEELIDSLQVWLYDNGKYLHSWRIRRTQYLICIISTCPEFVDSYAAKSVSYVVKSQNISLVMVWVVSPCSGEGEHFL